MTTLHSFLRQKRACRDAQMWLYAYPNRTLEEVYTLTRADWLLWLGLTLNMPQAREAVLDVLATNIEHTKSLDPSIRDLITRIILITPARVEPSVIPKIRQSPCAESHKRVMVAATLMLYNPDELHTDDASVLSTSNLLWYTSNCVPGKPNIGTLVRVALPYMELAKSLLAHGVTEAIY